MKLSYLIASVLFSSSVFFSCIEKESPPTSHQVEVVKSKKQPKTNNAKRINNSSKIKSKNQFYSALARLNGFTKSESYQILFINDSNKTDAVKKAHLIKILGKTKYNRYVAFRYKNYNASWN